MSINVFNLHIKQGYNHRRAKRNYCGYAVVVCNLKKNQYKQFQFVTKLKVIRQINITTNKK